MSKVADPFPLADSSQREQAHDHQGGQEHALKRRVKRLPSVREVLPVVLGIVFLYVILLVLLSLLASPNEHLLSDVEVQRKGDGPLLVLVHGMPGRGSLDSLLAAISSHRELREVDLLVPRYESASYMNSSPRKLAERLQSAIGEAAGPEQEIILAGHSLGGVLVRHAYLDSLRRGGWAKRVKRIVLLAAVNRGWTNGIARNTAQRALIWLGEQLYPAFFVGGLYEELRWGSPYITGVRLRWMNQMRSLVSSGLRPPPVVQIRGDLDTTVSPRDSADLEDTPKFSAVELPFTDHASLLQLQGDYSGPRRRMILDAISGKSDSATGFLAGPQSCDRSDPNIEHVIFAIHGMRTNGMWTDKFVNELKQSKLIEHGFIKPVTYDWFPMVPFLFGSERKKRLENFLDEYTQAQACYPNARAFSVVAHSNGSYIVVRAMERVPELRLDRLALAGSVLPQDFDWATLRERGKDRVGKVVNYTASKDWIVGIFPKLYELWNGDLGGAGFKGFHKTLNMVENVRGFPGGHSAVVDSAKGRAAIAHFLARDEYLALPSENPPWWAEGLSQFCGFVWLFLVAVLGGIGFGLEKWRRYARLRNAGQLWASIALASYALVILGVGFFF